MKKGDIIVIFCLVVIFSFSLVLINKSFITTTDKYISIQVNGEEIKQITKESLSYKNYIWY